MFFDLICGLAIWLLLVPTLYILGNLCSRLVEYENQTLRAVLIFAAGYGGLVFLLNLLSLCGFFHRYAVLGTIFLIQILGIRHWKNSWISLKNISQQYWRPRSGDGFLGLLLLLTLLLTFTMSFLPEIANDALGYQLNIPKCFVRAASLTPLYENFNSYTPILMNHLYSLGLLFNCVSSAKLFHWFSGFLAGALIISETERLSGKRSLALLMGLTFLLMPTILNEMPSTYVDVAVSLFFFLSFLLLLRGFEAHSKWLMLASGLMCGFAVSTKVLHLIGLAPLGIIMLMHLNRKWRSWLMLSAFFSFGLVMASGGWFIRNWIMEGNPLFPYLGRFFGPEEFDFVGHFKEMGPPKTFFNYLLLPLNMVIRPGDYGRGYWMGPALLVLLPFFIYATLRDAKVCFHGIFCWIYVSVWFCFFHNARFLTPVYPVYLTAAGVGVVEIARKIPLFSLRFWANIAYTALLLLLLLLDVYHYRFGFLVLLGRWDKNIYLEKMERSWPAAKWVNHELPLNAKILNLAEPRQFYFDRDMAREIWFRLRTHYDQYTDVEELSSFLKSNGFTHIMGVISQSESAEGFDTKIPILNSLMRDSGRVALLQRIESKNIREKRFVYEIYKIL